MISRRQFLRGNFSSRPPPQRPPWALAEPAFLAACTRCGDCAGVCPTQIIEFASGYPEVNFRLGECTFCGECVAVCTDGALKRGKGRSNPWLIRAQVAEVCVAQRGVECRVCCDPCPESAIRFSPRLGGPPLPEIDSKSCTGCGACVAPCPADAIRIA